MGWVLDEMKRPRLSADVREAAILDYIKKFYKRHGFGPTIRDIQAAVPSSTSTIHTVLRRLQTKGEVSWNANRSRTLTPVHKDG